MSISELLPSVTALSHADKFKLVQLLLAQLAQEDGVSVHHPRSPSSIQNASLAWRTNPVR